MSIVLDGDDDSSDGNAGVQAADGVYGADGGYLVDGNLTAAVDVLFGDVNGDGYVNLIDALLQRGRNGSDDIWADLNGDGVVNLLDALLLRGRNGTSLW